MSLSDLQREFDVCRRYRTAKSWQKPLLNPHRFFVNQFRKYGVIRTRLGALREVESFHLPRLTVVDGEAVSEQIVAYGIYEDSLTESFLRLIKPGQVVVDIGMHLGYYTTLFACLVGEGGQVHAFEPTPSTREIAERNVECFPQIEVYPFAVWSTETTLTFRDYGPRWMAFNSFTAAKLETGPPEPKLLEVQTTTLDRFRDKLDANVSLIKIDAESAEQEILVGARNLLAHDRPILSVEVGDVAGQS